MRSRQIVGLDLVRFFAAAIVVAFHLTYWIGVPGSTPFAASKGVMAGSEGIKFGWVGVEIFFVISGFVIAYSAASSNAGDFFRSRVLRLWPAALVCATLSLLVALLLHQFGIRELVTRYVNSVLFIPVGSWIDGVYWTLGVEIAFYSLIWTLLVLQRFHWLEGVVSSIGLVSTAIWVVHTFGGQLAGLPFSRIAQLLLLVHGAQFALGAIIWLALFDKVSVKRALLFVVFAFGAILEICDRNTLNGAEHAVPPIIPCVVWAVAVGLIIASVVFQDALLKVFGRFAGFARTLGLATYPLYLLHQLIGSAAIGWLVTSGVPVVPALVLSVTGVTLLAILVADRVEPAIRKVLSPPLRFVIERFEVGILGKRSLEA